MTATTDNAHAIDNARAHLSTIEALWEADDFLEDPRRDADGFAELSDAAREQLRDLLNVESFDDLGRDDAEQLEAAAREQVLSACVRSCWTPVSEPLSAGEFELLLSTGGPACRIVGDLDDHGDPSRAEIQWQDWGTPWTALAGQRCDALDWFAGLFYWEC
jgi:hypothetical protein